MTTDLKFPGQELSNESKIVQIEPILMKLWPFEVWVFLKFLSFLLSSIRSSDKSLNVKWVQSVTHEQYVCIIIMMNASRDGDMSHY